MQRFDAYGNVIPIFVFKLLRGETITIFGDGEQTRDFVNVADVVKANTQAAMNIGCSGAYTVASGTRITINHLVDLVGEAAGLKPHVVHGPERAGDVRDSLADISAARRDFGFEPSTNFTAELKEYVDWARTVVNEA